MAANNYTPIPVMDLDLLEDIAFNGKPMPDLRSQAQCVLFQALRNLYDYARRVQMPLEQGRKEKQEILKAYKTNRFIEEVEEASVQMWSRIEILAAEYANNRTAENADKLFEAIRVVLIKL